MEGVVVYHWFLQPDSYNSDRGTVGIDLVTSPVDKLANLIPGTVIDQKSKKRSTPSSYKDLLALSGEAVTHVNIPIQLLLRKGLAEALRPKYRGDTEAAVQENRSTLALDGSVQFWAPSHSWSPAIEEPTENDRHRMRRVGASQMKSCLERLLPEDTELKGSPSGLHGWALGLFLLGCAGGLALMLPEVRNALFDRYPKARLWATG